MQQNSLTSSVAFFACLITCLISITATATTSQQSNNQTVEELPVEYFFKRTDIISLKISPTGEYYAAKINMEGKARVAVLDRKTLKLKSILHFKSGSKEVGSYGWLNNERIFVSMIKKVGPLDTPAMTGEMYAANFDGKKKIQLFPKDGFFYYEGATKILSYLKDEPKYILIQLQSESRSYAYRLNIYSGRLKKVTKSPLRVVSFGVDSNDQIRLASGYNQDNKKYEIFIKNKKGSSWQLIDSRDEKESRFYIIDIMPNSNDYYVYREGNGKDIKKGIYAYSPAKQSFTLLTEIKGDTQLSGFLFNEQAELIGYKREVGKIEHTFIHQQDNRAKLIKELLAIFPGQDISITSETADNQFLVIQAYSGKHPNTYYLYDNKNKKINYLLSTKQWIDPKKMAEREAISFNARDGLEIRGYLTRPLGKTQNLPMVLLVHGGPYGVKDEWHFDQEAQFIANRGYAVLQVNYRGSGGRGSKFQYSNYRKVGAEMQDDLTDATLWAIDQGIADKERICIYGASYGGYAALMGAVKEPDLYKCAIPYVGVYDIALQTKYSDTAESKDGRKFLKDAWNAYDEEFVKERSPIYHLDKLKAPLFIIHGEDDPRCPIEQYEALTEALDERNIKYESMVKKHEGHGFYKLENVYELYNRLADFLDTHIGEKRS